MKFGTIISIKLYIKYNLITSLSNDLDNKNDIEAYEMAADFELHPYKNNATVYNGIDIERRKNR